MFFVKKSTATDRVYKSNFLKRFLNMSSDSESSIYTSSECGSSGNEADSEGEEVISRKGMDEMIEKLKRFNPYMFEPEKEVSSRSSSDESTSSNSSTNSVDTFISRVGILDSCKCQKCVEKKREIDCLCCQEVAALNSKFNNCDTDCITESPEFTTLCLNESVLKNVLTGLHISRGDYLEDQCSNHSLRYAAYKEFVWWIFESLGKGNRRVIPSCVIWKIRNTYPEHDGQYTLYSDGHKD